MVIPKGCFKDDVVLPSGVPNHICPRTQSNLIVVGPVVRAHTSREFHFTLSHIQDSIPLSKAHHTLVYKKVFRFNDLAQFKRVARCVGNGVDSGSVFWIEVETVDAHALRHRIARGVNITPF